MEYLFNKILFSLAWIFLHTLFIENVSDKLSLLLNRNILFPKKIITFSVKRDGFYSRLLQVSVWILIILI